MTKVLPVCLDLCSGLGGFSEGFLRRGWRVIRVDYAKQFGTVPFTFVWDLMKEEIREKVKSFGPITFVVAGVPCECFSVMTIGKNWTKDHKPKTHKAQEMLDLALSIHDLIVEMNPTYYAIENPRGKLRRLFEIHRNLPPLDTTWWCQWRDIRGPAKPTDIFSRKGKFPSALLPLPKCKNGNPDHDPAPRKTKIGGTQDQDTPPWVRALIPLRFSEALASETETELGLSPMSPPPKNHLRPSSLLKAVMLEDFG